MQPSPPLVLLAILSYLQLHLYTSEIVLEFLNAHALPPAPLQALYIPPFWWHHVETVEVTHREEKSVMVA